jgi:hypothetical protein
VGVGLGRLILERDKPVGFQALAPLLVSENINQDSTEGREKQNQREDFGVFHAGKPQ